MVLGLDFDLGLPPVVLSLNNELELETGLEAIGLIGNCNELLLCTTFAC